MAKLVHEVNFDERGNVYGENYGKACDFLVDAVESSDAM